MELQIFLTTIGIIYDLVLPKEKCPKLELIASMNEQNPVKTIIMIFFIAFV